MTVPSCTAQVAKLNSHYPQSPATRTPTTRAFLLASRSHLLAPASVGQHLQQSRLADLADLAADEEAVIQCIQLLAFWELVGGSHLE